MWLIFTVNERDVQQNQALHNRYDYDYPYNRPRKRHERDGAVHLMLKCCAKVKRVLVLKTLSTA